MSAISSLGYSFSPNLGTLLIFRILHGASFSVTTASTLAWATDFIPQNRLGEGIGYLGISQIAATAFGPQLGITIAEKSSLSTSFLVASVFLIIAVICMSFVSNKQKEFFNPVIGEKEKIKFKNLIAVEILPLAAITGLFSLGSGFVSSFLVLMGKERGIAGVGLYFTVNALFLVLTRPLSGKIYDKKGLSVILYPALLFAIAEAFLLGHANVLWMILLAAIFKAFGQGFAQPALQAESINRLGSAKKGIASSTYYVGASVGQGFGPLVGGALATSIGYKGMFNCIAFILFIGIIGYSIYSKKYY